MYYLVYYISKQHQNLALISLCVVSIILYLFSIYITICTDFIILKSIVTCFDTISTFTHMIHVPLSLNKFWKEK